MPISVTPVLSASAGYVSDVRDQVMAILRNVIMNPGFTSSIWEHKLVSFRELAGEYGQDRRDITANLSSRISTLLHTKFSDIDFNIDIHSKEVTETTYSIIFDITINTPDGDDIIPAIVSGQFLVDSETYDIHIKWNNSLDTASLMDKVTI